MSRKHFIALAQALRNSRPPLYEQVADGERKNFATTAQWDRDVLAVADAAGQFNSQFDRRRFLSAAGYMEKL